MVRVFLVLSAILWLPYGVFCFLRPDALADFTGASAVSTTANVELRAMYGGLQAALGVIVEGELPTYTAAGLGFEFVSAGAAIWLVRRDAPIAARALG